MYAETLGCVLVGIEARLVQVEVDIGRGLPAFEMVGQPAAVVKESRDRIRSAFRNIGLEYPTRRITVNLAPAGFRKNGSFLDLPIAMAILAASGQLPAETLKGLIFAGELALDGEIREVTGLMTAAILARRLGRGLVAPAANQEVIKCVTGLRYASFAHLSELITALKNGEVYLQTGVGPLAATERQDPWVKRGIIGGVQARRCLNIAAAGRHNLALIGPPGVGKTLLAGLLWEMLPGLGQEEALEVAGIHSAIGLSVDEILQGKPPFRSPHHTITTRALVGGGYPLRPGEITLAHRGLLFLDELPEYAKEGLNAIREPLESKVISLQRQSAQVVFPADFQLVAAFNLCPCGYHYFQPARCDCSTREVNTYLRSISGPIADRIDLQLPLPRPLWEEKGSKAAGSFPMSITQARTELRGRELAELEARLPCKARNFLRTLTANRGLSARAYFKILSVASTIAALEASETIESAHVAEAWQYRWDFKRAIGGESDVAIG